MSIKSIDLIIPCFNESESLIPMYNETKNVIEKIEGYHFNIIFINDGSKDSTLSLIKTISENDNRVNYISFSRNFGKEAGMYAGLEKSTGDYVAILDADLQDPPSLLVEMINYIEQGYDCCATRRISRTGEPPIRSFFARQFYKLMNLVTNIELVDGARDFRLMTRQMVDSVIAISERERFSKGIFSWVGFSTKWIEYENIDRIAGETKWSFWKLFKYAIGGITSFTTIPLRMASIMGACVSTFAFLFLFFIVIRTIIFGVDIPGYASTITVVLFVGGLCLLSIGILGEYVARIFIEVKRRPIYFVKEEHFNDHQK